MSDIAEVERYRQQRRRRHHARLAMSLRCPECNARPGRPCKVLAGGARARHSAQPHEARIELAVVEQKAEDMKAMTTETYQPESPEEAQYLASYNPAAFPVTVVTTDVVVFARERSSTEPVVALVRRSGWPYRGYWALPGGFIDQHETIAEAAVRELHEETGLVLSTEMLWPLGVFDNPHRDPRARAISHAYAATIEHAVPAMNAGDDAAEVAWFPVSEVVNDFVLAFDHREIIRVAMDVTA